MSPLAVFDVVDPKRHMVGLAVVSAAIKVCLVQLHCDASVGKRPRLHASGAAKV